MNLLDGTNLIKFTLKNIEKNAPKAIKDPVKVRNLEANENLICFELTLEAVLRMCLKNFLKISQNSLKNICV